MGTKLFHRPFQRAEFEENINHSVELCRINKDFELFTNSIKNHYYVLTHVQKIGNKHLTANFDIHQLFLGI